MRGKDQSNSQDISSEQRIYEAAEKEFMTKGYDGAKMVRIARLAGVSHSMLHYYYRDKETLFLMILDQKVKSFHPIKERLLKQSLSAQELVRGLIEATYDFMEANPDFHAFILKSLDTDIVSKGLMEERFRRAQDTDRALCDYLREAMVRGEIRTMEPEDILLNITGLCHSSVMQLRFICSDEEDRKAYLDRRRRSTVDFVLAALTPASPIID